MKKKLLLLAVAMAVIALGIGSTISYFNSKDTADNVFTVGDVKISLTEDKWKPEEDHLIRDNQSYDKNPVVENTGKNPAWIRIHVKLSDNDGMKAVLNNAEPDSIFTGTGTGYESNKWEADTENPKISGREATYTYYYHMPLAPGEKTEALFEKVIFPDNLDQTALSALSETFSISIFAEAVQSEDFESREKAFEAFDNN